MEAILSKLTTPLEPAKLAQALHPDLGLGLAGATPTARVLGAEPDPRGPTGQYLVHLAPAPRHRRSGPTVTLGVEVDGVFHRRAFEVRSESRRPRRLTLVVAALADDPVVRQLRGGSAVGRRVRLETAATRPRPTAARNPGGTGVHFAASGVAAEARPGETLLEVAERSGLEPATGCRRGVCHRCSTQLLAGSTSNSRDASCGEAGDSVRICVSTATSDVEVDL
ncbi:MAG: iron-sulfur cluster-binding domain-containing protein [Microthrixaceae bacterium]